MLLLQGERAGYLTIHCTALLQVEASTAQVAQLSAECAAAEVQRDAAMLAAQDAAQTRENARRQLEPLLSDHAIRRARDRLAALADGFRFGEAAALLQRILAGLD